MTKKHGFVRRGNEGHVLDLARGESDTLLKFTTPRDKATVHHRYKASTRAVVNAIGKGRVLPNKKQGGDETDKKKGRNP